MFNNVISKKQRKNSLIMRLMTVSLIICLISAIPVLAAAGDTTGITEVWTAGITGLKAIVYAIGGGLLAWGLVNLLEGYGGDNPQAKSQGIKQLMAGGGLAVLGYVLIPKLETLISFS